ncbi:DUF4184 family protein [Streptomyces sp. x-80]|uniref:DUF4184 family protein n=1 Tax=Streptomyces sp. x-80 TaxID=2789282 RepID=UPI003980AC16
MPYTLAHPAAVIPFCQGRLMPSALVVGAMAPDWAGLLPLPGASLASHEWRGIVTVDLTLGMLLLVLFHGLLKQPLLDLAPERLRARLAAPAAGFRWRSWSDVGYALLAVALGAATHVLWDDLTHGQIVDLGGYEQLVQDGSTILGLLWIGWFLVSWCRRAPETVAPVGLAVRARIAAQVILAGAVVVPAIMTLLSPPRPLNGEFPTGAALLWWYTAEMALAGINTGIPLVMAYAVLWQLRRAVLLARGV